MTVSAGWSPLHKGALWLALTLISALCAYYAITQYVAKQGELWSEAQVEELDSFVVAATDIAAGEVIQWNHLRQRELPLKYAQSSWLGEFEAEQLIGKVAAVQLDKGAPIRLSEVVEQRAATLSDRLDRGERAVTVAISNEQVMAGMLSPDDHVDLVGTVMSADGVPQLTQLSNIAILAIDQLQHPLESSSAEQLAERYFSSLTLRLTVAEASVLEQLVQVGFRVWLRSPTDDSTSGQFVAQRPRVHYFGGTHQ